MSAPRSIALACLALPLAAEVAGIPYTPRPGLQPPVYIDWWNDSVGWPASARMTTGRSR